MLVCTCVWMCVGVPACVQLCVCMQVLISSQHRPPDKSCITISASYVKKYIQQCIPLRWNKLHTFNSAGNQIHTKLSVEVRHKMMDRNICRKLKGNVLDCCLVPSSTYDLGTVALSKQQPRRLQVCENNWIRMAGVKSGEKGNERPKRSSWNQGLYNRQIVKSQMKWSGHIVRMKDERLPKREVVGTKACTIGK